MTAGIFTLSELGSIQENWCGNKVSRAAKLLSAGFPTPDGFCVPVGAYFQHVQTEITQEWVTNRLFGVLRTHIQQVEMNRDLQAEILKNYRDLQLLHPGPVAVRSSSTAEDLAGHSFAGLYETVLNVVDESMLLNAIRACWASYWSEEAVAYRDRIGMEHARHGMAVLVQTMIPAKYAGVLFTHAPADRNLSLVEFVAGNGSLLVDGGKYDGRCLVERDTGKIREALGEESLPRESLHTLTSLGCAIADQLGGPQDIEWCLDHEDHVWILQARPITTPASAQDSSVPAGMERVYDEPFSVLGCDLAVRRHKAWVAAINRFHLTGFPSSASTDGVYVYRTTPWRSASWLLNLWMKLWKSLRWLQADHIQRKYDQKTLPGYVHKLTELNDCSLTELTDRELLTGLNLAVDAYLEYQFNSYAVGEVAVLSASILERISKFIPGKHLDFLTGLNSITVERDATLHGLGEMLGGLVSPETVERLEYTDLEQKPALQAFLVELRRFQDAYGYVWADRYPRDPAWQVNTEALMMSLRHAASVASGRVASLFAQRSRGHANNVNEAAERLARFPILWFLLRTFLRRAERLFPYKEDRNHFVYQGVMVIQKYARAIGSRLQSHGILPLSEDIFFLTWDEIQAIVPRGLATDIINKVDARRMAYRLQLRDALKGEGNDVVAGPAKDLLKGDPCSPGVGSGVARLIRGPGDLQRVHPGEVMVCRHFRPAWSAVFARLSGAVIEEGGTLSHGATLAREYGIPAVINVPGAVQLVQDGSRIVVDGTRGLVLLNNVVPGTENF